jgi:aminoglycoside phosphotransferase (APT) family kinase protein
MTGSPQPPPRDEAALRALAGRVRALLAESYPGWAGDLVAVGQGFEAAVFRTDVPPFGTVAVKAPWRRFPGGSYGAGVDCRALLRQERALAAWAAANGLPAATPHALYETDAQDLLVSAYVEGDDRPPDPAGLGALLRRLHDALPPDLVPVTHGPSGDFRTAIAARILERLDRVEVLIGETLSGDRSWLDAETLRAALPEGRRALLHLDFRPANLRCRDGRIRAVLDWSNAALADPVFELARMHEAGTLSDAVLAGYGDCDWSSRVPPGALAACHLDAALMFAIVFRVGEPNPARAADATRRAREMLEALRNLSRCVGDAEG